MVSDGGISEGKWQARKVGFYLLDFGQCDTVDLGEDSEDALDVYLAFLAAMSTGDNALYIPQEEELFGVFKGAYLRVADMIIKDRRLGRKFDAEELTRGFKKDRGGFL